MSDAILARRAAFACAVLAVTLAAVCGVVDRQNASADSDTRQSPSASSSTGVRVLQERVALPYETVEEPTSALRAGTSKTVRSGVPGEALVTYRVVYRGDEEIERREVERKVVRKPVSEIVQVGTASAVAGRGRYASRGYLSGKRVLVMVATGYDPSPASNGGYSRTSTGLKIGHGVVAVDPRVIPIGTKLYIEGYGMAVAADVGGAIKGNRIDLGHDSARGARNTGRRLVRVHILD